MKLAKWWLVFSRPYAERLLAYARESADVSFAEYTELKNQYNRLYKNEQPN
jgi:hypothetical protein